MKLLLAGAMATPIGIPGAMASYNFVTLIDLNRSGFTLASGQLPPPESHVMYLTKRPPCT